MNGTALKSQKTLNLKVLKSDKKKEDSVQKIYINTLTPNFKYTNSKGKEVTPTSSPL